MSKNPRRGDSAPLSVSQNFLTSQRVIRSLLDKTDLQPGELVYEMGPGKGHITRALLARGARVRAVELDPALFQKLRETLAGQPGLSLRRGDFLAEELPRRGRYAVFCNPPFSQTTALIRKLTGAGNPPRRAWLIVEQGAAIRLCSAFQRDISRADTLSLSLRPYFELRIVARVRREDFHPMPSVDCVLLSVRRRAKPDLDPSQRGRYQAFTRLVKAGGPRSLLTRRQIDAALRRAGLPPIPPDGTLLYVQWLCLFRAWEDLGGPSHRKR